MSPAKEFNVALDFDWNDYRTHELAKRMMPEIATFFSRQSCCRQYTHD